MISPPAVEHVEAFGDKLKTVFNLEPLQIDATAPDRARPWRAPARSSRVCSSAHPLRISSHSSGSPPSGSISMRLLDAGVAPASARARNSTSIAMRRARVGRDHCERPVELLEQAAPGDDFREIWPRTSLIPGAVLPPSIGILRPPTPSRFEGLASAAAGPGRPREATDCSIFACAGVMALTGREASPALACIWVGHPKRRATPCPIQCDPWRNQSFTLLRHRCRLPTIRFRFLHRLDSGNGTAIDV